MTDLAIWTLALGAVKTLGALGGVLSPSRIQRLMKAFPPHIWMGRLLASVDLIWASYMLYDMPLGPIDKYKPALYVLCPISIFLICRYMDELLAPRALGGLYLLIPTPVLEAARWHPSPWRYVIIVSMYIMIVFGMWLVLAPYRFRHVMERVFKDERSVRMWSVSGVIAGAGLIALALLAFR